MATLAQRRYRQTDKYRQTHRRYVSQPHRKAAQAVATAKWYASTSGRAKSLWHSAKQRAQRKGLSFALTEEWIRLKLESGRCEATGIPFEFATAWGRVQKNAPFSPSVDRIDSAIGYTEQNCRVVLWALNASFGPYGEAVYERIARAYLARKDEPR